MPEIRLDKLISAALGVSRREARAIIRAGRARVDGEARTAIDAKADPERQEISADGESLSYRERRYFLLNKPAGYICATEDRTLPVVTELLGEQPRGERIFPVGRLDRDTTGLLLLTDDGDFAHRVTSPRHHVAKLYEARLDIPADATDAAAFARGITLGDGTRCQPAELETLDGGLCRVTVYEGMYHQVKRMLAARGKNVLALRRLAIGSLELPDELDEGDFLVLTDAQAALALTPKTPETGKK